MAWRPGAAVRAHPWLLLRGALFLVRADPGLDQSTAGVLGCPRYRNIMTKMLNDWYPYQQQDIDSAPPPAAAATAASATAVPAKSGNAAPTAGAVTASIEGASIEPEPQRIKPEPQRLVRGQEALRRALARGRAYAMHRCRFCVASRRLVSV